MMFFFKQLRTYCGVSPLVLLTLLPSQGDARTWNVSSDGLGDAPTIQAGIDSSAAGDTVLVFPGTYNEAINFSGKDIVVKSQNGPEQTIIDATTLGTSVVSFAGGETRLAVLEGLTIRGGTHGVFIESSEPVIQSNIIIENLAVGSGGGLILGSNVTGKWSPLIAGNYISRNISGNIGGGITVWDFMYPEIFGNTIAENEAVAGDGGGIFYRGRNDGGIIRDNVIADNLAGDHGGGIVVGASSSHPVGLEIGWNMISGNRANGIEGTGYSGGGIILSRTTAWVHHNTIVMNAGDGPGGPYGGGIAIFSDGKPVVEKNIIALSEVGGGIFCDDLTSPIIRNNLAWQNLGGEGVGNCPDWWQTDGNVVTDPYFCDATSGDFSLAQNSPALTHPAGPLGAFHLPGCGVVAVEDITWGALKVRYLNDK